MERKKYKVDKREVLFDSLLLADGIFDAEIITENQTLLIKFGNGQEFILSLQEIKTES